MKNKLSYDEMEKKLHQLEDENQKLRIDSIQYRKLMDSSEHVVISVEADRIVDCNHQAELFFARDKKYLINTSLFDFFPEELVAASPVKSEFSNLINEITLSKDNHFTWKFKSSTNDILEATVIANHIEKVKSENVTQLIIKPVPGIHGKKKKSESDSVKNQNSWKAHEMLRVLFKNMRDGFIQTDLEGNFKECNTAFCEIVDYSESELKKLSIRKITPEKWQQFEQRIIKEHVLKQGL